ncbi:hypothetical protein [Streptomyces specialis]|uniref:hypothetical protein n=1 Tax=Streptomyces specialis TaxID=498367 RepID=UPI00073F56B9|nr:hypothetical protein [Streptomyces specialis]
MTETRNGPGPAPEEPTAVAATGRMGISGTGGASASADSIAVSGGVTGGIHQYRHEESHGPLTWLQHIGVFLPGSLPSRKRALAIVCLLALLLGGVAWGVATGTPPFGGSRSDPAGEAPRDDDGGGAGAEGAAADGGSTADGGADTSGAALGGTDGSGGTGGTGDEGSGTDPGTGPEDGASGGDTASGGTATEPFRLSAPTLLAPGNEAVLDATPRTITFTWQGVTGAADYRIEVECRCGGDWSSQAAGVTAATSHDVTWPDAAEGRWRVTARAGDEAVTSDWWYFRYTTGLAAPAQVYPAHGSVFTHYPRTMTLDWDPVPGAAGYRVEVEYYALEQWNALLQEETPDTGHTFDFVGAGPGRWRVTATDGDGTPGASTGWWEFTYTQ